MKDNLIHLFILLSILSCNPPKNTVDNPSESKFISIRNGFKTNLIKKEKSPQDYSNIDDQSTAAKLVYYNSNGLQLKGLLDTTNIINSQRRPVVVYLHGGFALGYGDLQDCQPFINAGYIVFAPTYRGENGNNGNFELFMGEVDDAKEAIKWISQQSYVDTNQVFVFGHSIGGAMALLLSLHPGVPIKMSGSSGGLYEKEAIEYWDGENILPFDPKNEEEVFYRLPLYTLNEMVRKHSMFIGTGDGFDSSNEIYTQLYPNQTKLKLIPVPGDHFSSLTVAMNEFVKETKKK